MIYRAPALAAPLALDGRFDKPAWRAAPVVALLDNGGGPARQITRAHLAHSAEYLYVGFFAEGAACTANLAGYNRPIYDDSVVELFLADGGDPHRYHEFEVNPLGAALHYYILHSGRGAEGYAKVVPAVRAAVLTDRARGVWQAELAIEIGALTQLAWGAPLPFNLYRIEGAGEGRSLSALCPTRRATFHCPEAFGSLVLAHG